MLEKTGNSLDRNSLLFAAERLKYIEYTLYIHMVYNECTYDILVRKGKVNIFIGIRIIGYPLNGGHKLNRQ